jgi:hypothetical protein
MKGLIDENQLKSVKISRERWNEPNFFLQSPSSYDIMEDVILLYGLCLLIHR